MTAPNARTLRKFNPGLFQSDREVIEQFVVRHYELERVLEILRGNVDSPSCQHVLVVAPRGRGKTMLLARVAAELRTDEALSRRLLPVRFMEESHEILGLADFWLEALFHLARETDDPALSRELRDTHADLKSRWRERELSDRARAAVVEAAELLDRRLVLMVENLQALCDPADADFGWGLRQALQSEPRIMLLATATSRFAALDDARQPFFELFWSISLEPLDREACRRLWRAVAGDGRSDGEIRALQILTGGSPRLLVIVAEFARHRSLRRLMDELVALIDDHTEYFRGHLESLARTERRVYLAAVDLWRPSSTGEIAARAAMDVRPVSTMLGRLVDRGAIAVEGTGRKRRYAAAERLYCIYYKLRRERDEAAVVQNLIRFMAVFYGRDELADLSGLLRAEAMQSAIIREGIERAIAEAPEIGSIFPGETWPNIARPIGLAETSEIDLAALVKKAASHAERDESEAMIVTCDQIIERFGDDDTSEVRLPVARALFNKGLAQGKLGDPEAAIKTYDQVIERFGDDDTSEVRLPVARALFNKGLAQGKLGDPEAVITTYDQVIERFGDNETPGVRTQVARALVGKGLAQEQLGGYEAATTTYDQVIERFGDDGTLGVRAQGAWALIFKGLAQEQLGGYEAAITTYDQVIERFGDDGTLGVRAQGAWALIFKGLAQEQLGGYEAAITTYDQVIERFSDDGTSEVRARVARALVRKGLAQEQLGGSEAAITTYDQAIERFGDDDTPEVRSQGAWALIFKGLAQEQLGGSEAAITTYDQAIERFGDDDMPEVRSQVVWALVRKGLAQGKLGGSEAAITTYNQVIERFGNDDTPEVRARVAQALVSKGDTQGQLGGSEAAITTYDQAIECFDDDDTPEVRLQVAVALVSKGLAQRKLGGSEAAITTYDQAIERFGDDDTPEVRLQVTWALTSKGITQRQLGGSEAAITTYDQVIERFGNDDTPEVRAQVAWALVSKGDTQGQLGGSEAAITTYDHAIERFDGDSTPEIRAPVVRALANKCAVQTRISRVEDALDTFRLAYAAVAPDDRATLSTMQETVPTLIAGGIPERGLIEILEEDREKADALAPLVVALQQRAGDSVRAPAEVLEVAADILEQIEAKGAAPAALPDS